MRDAIERRRPRERVLPISREKECNLPRQYWPPRGQVAHPPVVPTDVICLLPETLGPVELTLLGSCRWVSHPVLGAQQKLSRGGACAAVGDAPPSATRPKDVVNSTGFRE
jgi:hypothetical protein